MMPYDDKLKHYDQSPAQFELSHPTFCPTALLSEGKASGRVAPLLTSVQTTFKRQNRQTLIHS